MTTTRMTMLALILTSTAALSACGQDSSSLQPAATVASSASEGAAPAEGDCNFNSPGPDRADLIGKSLDEARASEQAVGHTLRVVAQDGHCTARTDDLSQDRVDVSVTNGKVTWARMG